MLAIQNQISVLTKILETKIQQQQIVEYQQAVSASLNKVTSPKPNRSRKTSSNQDGNLSNVKDKKLTSTTSNNSIEKVSVGDAKVPLENAARDVIDNHLLHQKNSCVVS